MRLFLTFRLAGIVVYVDILEVLCYTLADGSTIDPFSTAVEKPDYNGDLGDVVLDIDKKFKCYSSDRMLTMMIFTSEVIECIVKHTVCWGTINTIICIWIVCVLTE